MTPNKQVSPAIRILRGERDASARATHLEAATRKFLVTTNERKQMSTKTNFKRIALVAVAALGLGVLSSVPSQAAISGAVVTVTNGTGSLATSDSTTGATINIRAFADAAVDSVTIQLGAINSPAGADIKGNLMPIDTSGATTKVVVARAGAGSGDTVTLVSWGTTPGDTATTLAGAAGVLVLNKGGSTAAAYDTGTAANAYFGLTVAAYLDSQTARTAGTYTGTVVVRSYDAGVLNATKTVIKDFTITIAAGASTLVADAGQSTAVLSQGTSAATRYDSADSTTVALSATAGTQGGVIRVFLRNYAGSSAQESLTVTTTKGTLGSLTGGSSGIQGKSFTAVYNTATDLANGYKDFGIYGDGTSGSATITIKSTSVTFANKTVSFYSTSVATIAKPTVLTTVIGTGASSTNLLAVAKDSEGNIAGSAVTLYAYSSDTTLASDNGSSCTFNADLAGHVCSVTGVLAGSPTFTVKNKSTVALSTVTSVASDAIRVSTATAATVKLTFDKATYAPNEKATLTITILDSSGKELPAGTFANTFATGGLSSTMAFGNGSDTITNVSVAPSTDVTKSRFTPGKTYTLYMPATGGTVTVSGTGGASLSAAGQVKVSTTVTVTDSAAAALAAVTALATTVASLKTLITTLTNLVLKIQKKVKA
jgi:trimeric autotransporter adhesin